MNIQIIGTKKSNNTKKAERFFKERGCNYHFLDTSVKAPSLGEIKNICSKINPEKLIDEDSKTYKKKGMSYMDYDPVEEILENPSLLKQPIVRNGKDVTVEYAPNVWDKWIKDSK